ncbi:MAG: hypothetical protein A2068_02780 [Ignavibacteria bacterium GWB2_35_6b]|nr:MAG: hypothetical protein A2068_02780 [Ignavibacteria bacterium GWB2_35_6b]
MIRIIKNIQEFKTYKEDCNRLADNFQMPLLRYEWLINCAYAVEPPGKLFVIVVHSEGRVKAIAPLILIKKTFTERLEMLGSALHNEPCGFLYEDENSLLELLQKIESMKKTIFYNGIRGFSLERAKLENILNQTKRLTFINSKNVPYLPVTGTWENFQKNISSSRRSSLRRLLRIAGSMGKPSVEIICPPIASVENYLNEILEIEASGWKKRMGTAMTVNKNLGEFFKGYSKEAADLKMLRLCFFRIDGVAIAAQIGIEYSNRFWLLKIGYNEKWARCSPGIILMNEVINYAFSKKLDAVEFLGSNEQWLHIWTNQFHDTVNYRIYNSPVSCIGDITYLYSTLLFNKAHSIYAKKKNRIRDLQNV